MIVVLPIVAWKWSVAPKLMERPGPLASPCLTTVSARPESARCAQNSTVNEVPFRSTPGALTASVAILAGIAVLIGAIAAARQARTYDSVILKTLGATRRQILAAQALEYALLALMLAALALGLGTLAAWYVITGVFEFRWAPDWFTVLATLGSGALLTLGIGLLGSLPVLSVRPAQALRRL